MENEVKEKIEETGEEKKVFKVKYKTIMQLVITGEVILILSMLIYMLIK